MSESKFRFKKKYGQNFIKDKNIIKKIVNISTISNNSLVIEVGPGSGALTSELAKVCDKVIAYEIDIELKEQLYNNLCEFNNIDILFKDFMDSNINKDIINYNYDNLYFISNIPYYITTPIILKLIDSGLKFNKIVLMVQKEVGERFSALPGTKEYSSITVLLNYFYDIKKEFIVSRKLFIPEPNVDSIIISFSEKSNRLPLKDFNHFEKLIRDSFQFKRKNIKNNLKKYNLDIISNVLNKYGYDLSIRAEELSFEVFVDISNSLFKN